MGVSAPLVKSADNQHFHFSSQGDIVGIMENKDKLMHWMTYDALEKNIKITTVWGMHAIGKSTLVANVYNTVKLNFDIFV